MSKPEINSICLTSKQEWRLWLEKNHISENSVWLIVYKKSSDKPTLDWSDAVDEALCFGWIDSTKKSIDSEKYMQYYSKRKPTSNWSKINKDKIKVLIKQGLMTEAGHKTIEVAKQNGSWTILDSVEKLIIPEDLEKAFQTKPNSKEYYLSLSKSVKKILLYWIISAKRPDTRLKRITEIVEQASKNQKPKQFR